MQTLTQRYPSSPCLHDDVRTRVWFEHGHLVRKNYQPSRKAVLEEVQRRRNAAEIKDTILGRVALTLPQYDYFRLLKLYPDLASQDPIEKSKAWVKFMASSESKQYRNWDVI